MCNVLTCFFFSPAWNKDTYLVGCRLQPTNIPWISTFLRKTRQEKQKGEWEGFYTINNKLLSYRKFQVTLLHFLISGDTRTLSCHLIITFGVKPVQEEKSVEISTPTFSPCSFLMRYSQGKKKGISWDFYKFLLLYSVYPNYRNSDYDD